MRIVSGKTTAGLLHGMIQLSLSPSNAAGNCTSWRSSKSMKTAYEKNEEGPCLTMLFVRSPPVACNLLIWRDSKYSEVPPGAGSGSQLEIQWILCMVKRSLPRPQGSTLCQISSGRFPRACVASRVGHEAAVGVRRRQESILHIEVTQDFCSTGTSLGHFSSGRRISTRSPQWFPRGTGDYQ